MLAYLISRKHVPTKGVLCILELGLMQENSLTQLIFLIACRNILFRWRLLFAIGTVEVDYHFPTITISKMAKCRSSPTQDIPIPQTDSTKPISRLKRM
jgi:DNA polymerase-3 subunit alpha/error-prone DNA polymerase